MERLTRSWEDRYATCEILEVAAHMTMAPGLRSEIRHIDLMTRGERGVWEQTSTYWMRMPWRAASLWVDLYGKG
jgi:hypothetical protein